MHIVHDSYYRDRLTVRDLCHDFPADEIFIDGLHAMQSHFVSHNVPVDIPIVRVMNAAHFMLAYTFSTSCSGDQGEYDALTYGSVGHDKKVMLVTLIVLAAMLKRTEGFRARQCRNMLLENRSEDFHEGVSLYDQFLRSAEKHFAEEDFLLDTHAQIIRQQEEITRLTSENIQLKYTITKMENQQNNQYNNCVIYNAPVYNTSTTNNYYQQAKPVEEVVPSAESAQEPIDSIIFTKKAKAEHKEPYIIHALQKSIIGRKDKTRALVQELQSWQNDGYVDAHYNAQVMFDELQKILPLPFGYEVFKKHYNNTRY